MVVLCDKDIKRYFEEGKLIVRDHNGKIDACSIDLRLSNKFRFFKKSNVTHIDVKEIDMDKLMEFKESKEGEPVVIHPRDLIIGSTIEHVELPDDLVGTLDGRSSLGRLGIVVHSTANSIDPGFKGNITLEMSNINSVPVRLWPGMRICRLTFTKLSDKCEVPYYKKEDALYKDSKGPVGTKIHLEK
ncbi:MAG: dCTP deaminase [Nanoarchaeota archaeon]|nr:dCTP deaminase [Nanoarchaeota archaeon]